MYVDSFLNWCESSSIFLISYCLLGLELETLENSLICCMQGLYEGLKAIRTEDGRILLFRTKENALRMKMGAERLCMPSPSVEQFVEAVLQTVHANKSWVLITF